MYPVSNDYKNAIKAYEVSEDVIGTVTLPNESVIDFDLNDIVEGAISYTEQCVSGSDLDIGSVYAAELSITLSIPEVNPYSFDGARIAPQYGVEIGEGDYEYVPLGHFYVYDIQRQSVGVALKAFDGMILLDKDLTGVITSGTPRELVVSLCLRCGVTLSTTSAQFSVFANSGEVLTIPEGGQIQTCRDLLMWVCQATCTFARFDRLGGLELVAVTGKASARTVDNDLYYDTPKVSDFSVKITQVQMTVSDTLYTAGSAGMTMTLEENPLMIDKSAEDINAMLAGILTLVTEVEYTPGEVELVGDPSMQPGDFVVITNLDSGDITAYITHSSWAFRGSHKLQAVGQTGILKGQYSQTSKAISSISVDAQKAINDLKQLSLADKDTAEGYELYTDKADDSVVHVELEGNTVESELPVINRVPEARRKFVGWNAYLGAEVILTQNQSVPGWGTTEATRIQITGGTYIVKYLYSYATSINGVTYRFKLFIRNNLATPMNIRGNIGDLQPISGNTTRFLEWEAVGNGSSQAHIQFQAVNIDDAIDVTVWNPQIYIMGKAPDNPYALQSVGTLNGDRYEFDLISSIGPRNLCRYTNWATDFAGWSVSGAGTIAVTEADAEHGTVLKSSRGTIYRNNIITPNIRKNDQIVISFWAKGNILQTRQIRITDGSGLMPITANINYIITTAWQYYQLTAVAQNDAIGTQGFFIYGSGTDEQLLYISNIKVELGTTATPWTPAPEDIPYNTDTYGVYKSKVLLSDQLRGLTAKDKIFRDSDGLWKREKKIRTVSVNISYSGTLANGNVYGVHNASDKKNHTTQEIMSNVAVTSLSREENTVYENSTNIVFVGNPNDTLETLRTKFNGTELLFVLATPIIETLPDDMQTLLNNLHSYSGDTYVYTATEIKPYLRGTFKSIGWYRTFSLQQSADQAMVSANEKNSIFRQPEPPAITGRKVGDTWFDTDDGNKIYTFDGSTWSAAQLGTNAIGVGVIDAANIANGAITSEKIPDGVITEAKFNTKTHFLF